MVQLRLPGYEGPLALLLELIEKQELDISEFSLVQVAEQFLDHVEHLRAHPQGDLADSLADFIVIGGKLMLLKSKTLLPREVDPLFLDDEEDVGPGLLDMLEEYRRYRDTVSLLGTIERSGLRSYGPGAPPPVEALPHVGLPDSVTLDLLSRLVREALARADERVAHVPEVALERDPVTVRDKIADLEMRLQRHGRVSFRSWIAEARTRVEVIVTFLAILELYKSRDVEMCQDDTYGDIVVEPRAGGVVQTLAVNASDATSVTVITD